MHLLLTVLAIALLSCLVVSNPEVLKSFKHAAVISGEKLQELKSSPSVTVVYYFTKDLPRYKLFYSEYDKSAKYLEAYNVKLAVFDCTADGPKDPMCDKDRVERNVYTYQKGIELLPLEVETMFDVNSIMSNALQLVLLHEVPIISSRLEKHELQKDLAGKEDLIFTYVQAVGTQEHRVYMEIAYTFQDRYKFALTTEFKSFSGLQDSEIIKPNTGLAMWVLLCSETSPEKVTATGDCRSVLYRGPFTLSALATYVQRLGDRTLFFSSKDGVTEMFEMGGPLPVIYVFKDQATSEEAEPVIDLLSHDLRGFAKVVIVEMDDEENKKAAESQGFHGSLPALSVKAEDGAVKYFDPSTKWTIENVQDFLVSYVFPDGGFEPGDTSEVVESTDLETQGDVDSLIEEVETQDDQVAEAVFHLQIKKMKLDHVPALMKATFYNTVKSDDLMVVLYYLPFDSVGMAFLRDFGTAAETLASNFSQTNVLARVNCFDASDLCTAENVTRYPLLRIHQKDEAVRDYKGPLDSASIVTAVRLLQLRSPFELKSEAEVEEFMKGNHPQTFSEFTPTSVLLLASGDNKDLKETFSDVSKDLSTVTAFAFVLDDLAKTIAQKYDVSMPSVIAQNRKDSVQPVRKLTSDFEANSMKDFVKYSTEAFVPELTVQNFPLLYARKVPFMILFVDKSDVETKDALEVLTAIATSGKFTNTQFCWMNAESKSMGQKILSEYTWTATLPMITVVDHRKAEVFNYQADVLRMDALTEWLDRVLTGHERPSKMLQDRKWGAPKRHYDFLAMMDKQEQGHNLGIQGEEEHVEYEQEQQPEENSLESDPARDEILEVDSDIREELLELRKSRLYHQSPERREAARKMMTKHEAVTTSSPQGSEAVVPGHDHNHVEL
ncbi:thioredoxin domain-containing protein 16 [Aplysia californica]|uniref:Thioredoxin domain-containing protein 16 n=1 Tax=Aplysia californica TaxID=6500 RepID=A0ABM0JWC4_APLCA|nr:thioredoxin domain-containing protein 16 [Aplysia californica]